MLVYEQAERKLTSSVNVMDHGAALHEIDHQDDQLLPVMCDACCLRRSLARMDARYLPCADGCDVMMMSTCFRPRVRHGGTHARQIRDVHYTQRPEQHVLC